MFMLRYKLEAQARNGTKHLEKNNEINFWSILGAIN